MRSSAAARSTLSWLLPLLAILLVLAIGAYAFWRQGQDLAPQPSAGPAASGLNWEVAFTSPLIPDDPSKRGGGIDTRLVALIDRATQTLDVAVYDFDLQNVAEAMARAAQRGVRVRMVTDTDTIENVRNARIQAAIATVAAAGVPIVPDNRGAIMHHKFTVVDGEWVQTGSWNYTDGDTYRLNNNVAIFRSRDLAQNYTAEFEKMFVQKRFGSSKPRGAPHPTTDSVGLRIQTLFAPQDRVGNQLVERVNAAQRSIRFMAFSFTHDALGAAILARASAGVEVRGVFENTGSNTRFSEYTRMKEAGLEVYQDGSPYAMHHKVILLDNRITIFGSFNFSNNADESNDENLLIVEDPQFTAEFDAEFQRMLALARNPPARK